jgi:ankyrin repeat protein
MNVQDEDGNTALHLAVAAEKLRMLCNLLTNRGVCLNLRNNKGQTALDLAMANIRKGFFYGRV